MTLLAGVQILISKSLGNGFPQMTDNLLTYLYWCQHKSSAFYCIIRKMTNNVRLKSQQLDQEKNLQSTKQVKTNVGKALLLIRNVPP